MIHIVFQRNDVDVLNEAIKLDDSLQGEVQMTLLSDRSKIFFLKKVGPCADSGGVMF
jgi:hypothetical protein